MLRTLLFCCCLFWDSEHAQRTVSGSVTELLIRKRMPHRKDRASTVCSVSDGMLGKWGTYKACAW